MKQKKLKPLTEMRIVLAKWQLFFSAHISGKGLASQEYADKIMELLVGLTEEHLLCNECKRVLTDEEFYNQQPQTARRHKAQICKECWAITYRGKK